MPDAAIYKRWVAFGLLSSHSRLHGSSTYRVPWNYNGEACDVLRFFTKLKCSLMPYLYGAAVEAHREGVPMMRAMILEFPHDPACDTLDRQYFLGGSLLVMPVLSADGWTSYYLPEGQWTNFLNGEVQSGGRWYRSQHGFLELPLFARPCSIIPVGAISDRPDYDLTQEVTFRAFEITDGATVVCDVPAVNGGVGVHFMLRRAGSQYEAEASGIGLGRWSLQLVGIISAGDIVGGTIALDPRGVVLTPSAGGNRIRFTLKDTSSNGGSHSRPRVATSAPPSSPLDEPQSGNPTLSRSRI
jgi:alpha-D-xyloside xylohydrolase